MDKGPFKDLFDFCERIDHTKVPKAAIEKLIKAGGFDRLGGHRSQLMEALPRAVGAAGQLQQDRRHGQGSLFEDIERRRGQQRGCEGCATSRSGRPARN